MKLILYALGALLISVAAFAMPLEDDGTKTVEELWQLWKAENNKSYATPQEDADRLLIFRENKRKIDEHNEKYKAGQVTWKQGLTLFADLTNEEFKRRHTGGLLSPPKTD